MTRVYLINRGGSSLIGNDDNAYLMVDDKLGYKFRNRFFDKALVPLFSNDYRDIFRGTFFSVMRDAENNFEEKTVYSGAEHALLPNITILPNIRIEKGFVFGSTMGHEQKSAFLPSTQEAYEFEGYGGMLLKNGKRQCLYVSKPGDKVLVSGSTPVPGDENSMTVFNFDSRPLVTLDISNPKLNKSCKVLQKKHGAPMLVMYDGEKVEFQPNVSYFVGGKECMKIPAIEIPNNKIEDVGEILYEALINNPDIGGCFADWGIEVRGADNEIHIGDIQGELKLWGNLEDRVQEQDVQDYFLLDQRTYERTRNRLLGVRAKITSGYEGGWGSFREALESEKDMEILRAMCEEMDKPNESLSETFRMISGLPFRDLSQRVVMELYDLALLSGASDDVVRKLLEIKDMDFKRRTSWIAE